MMKARWIVACAVASAAATGASALGQVPPSYGHDFVKIGAPGNRATIPHEVPFNSDLRLGKVDYEFRVTRTETTATQWLEFARAYAPYWTGSPSNPGFTSNWVYPKSGKLVIAPGAENWPVKMSWRMAARYCNWLHNDKRPEQWAFESGAYDTSTFTYDPKTGYTDQREHSPGAKYWITTRDERVKAAYYDPDRYGPGEEGYWRWPHGSMQEMVSGLPEEGGETNAGFGVSGFIWGMDAGSYPWAPSPWGILDASGGADEWTEYAIDDYGNRAILGSGIHGFQVFDILDDQNGSAGSPVSSLAGFRISSVVPAPSVLCILVACAGLSVARKRNIS